MQRPHWENQLSINYRTLAICQTALSNPFNMWAQTQIDQGFAWRPESVCFVTFESDTSCPRIEVSVKEAYSGSQDAIRTLRVPFQVTAHGIEITSPLSDAWHIDLPIGIYSLFYEIEMDPNGLAEEPWLYKLTFMKVPHALPPLILRADNDLNPPNELDMSALPA